MDIKYNYGKDTLSLISGSLETLPNDFPNDDKYNVKLSVYNQGGSYLDSFTLLSAESDYYKGAALGHELLLKPNDKLDAGEFFEGDYELRYDFLERYSNPDLYIDEISSTRQEIRIRHKDNSIGFLDVVDFLGVLYEFNCVLELPNNDYVSINAYAWDDVTYDESTLVLKLNTPFPTNIGKLSTEFQISKRFLNSQTQNIFLIDRESLALDLESLDIDESMDDDFQLNTNDVVESYNTITSSYDPNLIESFKGDKKDVNLNIDYSEFSNHVFFGSAEKKLKNFKDKVVKLDGLYYTISSSLNVSSSKNIIDNRKDLFKKIKVIEDDFTHYEKFLYNDGQSYSTASAPGLGVNLAGSDFNNDNGFVEKIVDQEGFNSVYHFTSSAANLHMFTDIYNVEEPPFYNTNNWVYLSFLLSGERIGTAEYTLVSHAGGSNKAYDSGFFGYQYNKNRKIPYEAFSGSAILNPTTTGSEYKRYIFKAQQNYWRPIEGRDILDISIWQNQNGIKYEILSGSNPISASTSGGVGDDFAYGIRDSSGQHTPYFFPNRVDENNLFNVNTDVTASVMSQGDLFPIRKSDSDGNWETYVTDIKVSYNNPTDIHPFSNVYRPPSGSYAGSTEWNNWYGGMISSASLYDTNNINSLTNNIPLFLREDEQHKILRDFIDMLGEEYDLLRNYIDNYHNFYKLGYKSIDSIPNNLLPIIADSVGWKLVANVSSSLSDYVNSNKTDEIGTKNAVDAVWKRILNNLIYIYKTKGTNESVKSLLNLYGFNADSFGLREYGGSTQAHNPEIITDDATTFAEGLGSVAGNVSYIEETVPFLMLNVNSGSTNEVGKNGYNRFGVDWYCDDAQPNGIELVFNVKESIVTQSLMRLSGSYSHNGLGRDLWNIHILPQANSNTNAKIQFRLNRTTNASAGSTEFSMETPYIDNLLGENIYNFFLQRDVGSDYEDNIPLTQSYHMFVARKENDTIQDVHVISMSISSSVENGISKTMAKNANRNFIRSGSLEADGVRTQNLLLGETITGSIAEIRAWDSYVSMSKFKQHTLNYLSVVGGTITSSFSDIIYRYRLNEGYINTNNTASVNINDSNPTHTKDYTHLLSTQDNLNYRSVTTEQIFYSFAARGVDAGDTPNNKQINIYPELNSVSDLNPNGASLTNPYDGADGRVFGNNYGKSLSYTNALNSLIFNMIPDFYIGDYLEDGVMDGVYSDLMNLRKTLIDNVSVDVVSNLNSAENFVGQIDINSIDSITPLNTQLEFHYDVRNDVLYRNKIKNAVLTSSLNANKVIGSASLAEPVVISLVNDKVKNGTILSDDEYTVTSLVNDKVKNGTILSDDEYTVTSLVNDKVKNGTILYNDEYTVSTTVETFNSNTVSLNNVKLTDSYKESVYDLIPSDWTPLLLGSKNEFYKNHGKSENQTFFKSLNRGNNNDYNTYKYEERFTFQTIGDTELYIPVLGNVLGNRQKNNNHEIYTQFFNRTFIDSGSYTYSTLFDANPTVDGRMVGRTSYFKSDVDGNITYPSNHYINARTSKDVLDNLIYKGTQHTGIPITDDPAGLDTNPTSPAYTTSVRGSSVSTLKIT